MNERKNSNPPQLLLYFFRWFCRKEYREDIEGDLLEQFHTRVTTSGTRKAKWLFAKDVMFLLRPGLIRTFKIRAQKNFFSMKKNGWIKIVGINLLLIAIIISPFLPGPPNKLVIGLSVLAQSAGFFGLLLVPVAVTWIILEIIKQKNHNLKNTPWTSGFYLSIAATLIISAMYLLLLVLLFHIEGIAAGLAGMVIGIFFMILTIRKIKQLKYRVTRKISLVPFYLLTIPLMALMTTVYLTKPLSHYSRNFAIQRSQPLITSIENFKRLEGRYPNSITELKGRYINDIPSPQVMGILNFRYNKIDDHYSISFSQWLDIGSLEEIVLYDKNNLRNNLKGVFAKYDYQFDLCRVQGAFASYDTRHDNWRYYLCD